MLSAERSAVKFTDKDVLKYIDTKKVPAEPTDPMDKLPRAFTLVANSSVPRFLQPLLKLYITGAQSMVRDPRDVVFVTHIIFAFFSVIPSALGLLYRFNWVHAIFHTVMLIVTIPPFILMLHCVCHAKLGKVGYEFLDNLIHFVLCPFYGQTWNTFYFHHVKHHHIEDNSPDDLSSTLEYDRDNALHFLHYFSRFYFFIAFELSAYFVRKGRYEWAVKAFCGEYLSLALIASLFYVIENPLSVVFACIVPLNFARLGMMTGNWTQHAFIDSEDPHNNYKTAITCVATPYNQTCFNDGYHISHHLNPRRHWNDHPSSFIASLDDYKKNTSVIFKGMDYWMIWCCLMVRAHRTLANHLVTLKPMTIDQKVAFLRSRLRRLTPLEIQKHYKSK